MQTVNDISKPSLDEALEHYGVKGMRWGVRRDQATLDRAAGRKQRRADRKANPPDRKTTAKKYAKIGANVALALIAANSVRVMVNNKKSMNLDFQRMLTDDKRLINAQKDRVLYMESNSARKGLEFLNSPKAKADLWQISENWGRGFYDSKPPSDPRKFR